MPPPTATATAIDTSKPIWVAGTPWWIFGEGYMTNYQVAPTADGPWDVDHLEEVRGTVKLAPGKVYRVRATRERSDQADAAETFLRVDEVLESQPGGPPLVVEPGVSVNGLSLADGDYLAPGATFGPIRVVTGGTEPVVQVDLDEVGSVKIGEVVFRAGVHLDDFAARLDGCGKPVRNRGATTIPCRGLSLIGAGPVPGANIRIEVARLPGIAAPEAACRSASDCQTALGDPPSDGKWECIDRQCQLGGAGPHEAP